MSKALTVTREIINATQTKNDIVDLPIVAEKWMDTLERTNAEKPGIGRMRYEAEKILFLQQVNDPKFDNVEKMSVFTAFMELAISGLTLRDGQSYIVPMGKKAVFMPGWKGRREQIAQLPTVVHVSEPEVVFDCDDFKYTKTPPKRILIHEPANVRPANAKITHVYIIIQWQHGPELYIMDAQEVYNIRNRRSSTFQTYLRDKAQNVQNIKEPMWVTDEIQAFKKTMMHRAYNSLPKSARAQFLDEKAAAAANEAGHTAHPGDFDPDEFNADYTDHEDIDPGAGEEHEAF